MLKPNKRLRGSQTVEAILEKGEFLKSKFFAVRSLPNQLTENRYSIIVSSKLEKSAVKRNRARRQIHAALEILEKAAVPKGNFFDTVILVRRAGLKLTHPEILAALREILPSHS